MKILFALFLAAFILPLGCASNEASKGSLLNYEAMREELTAMQAKQRDMEEKLERLDSRLSMVLKRFEGKTRRPDLSEEEEELVPQDLRVERLTPKKKAAPRSSVRRAPPPEEGDEDIEEIAQGLGRIATLDAAPKTITAPAPEPAAEEPKRGSPVIQGNLLAVNDDGGGNDKEREALAIYQAGFNFYAIDNCQAAEKKFSQFIATYPKHYYTDSALYYLAECHRKNDEPAKAEENYRKVSGQFPKSDKAPWSLFHLGKLRGEKNMAEGKKFFKEVIDRYPDSEAARAAKKELSKE